jgi:hypothetical protein
LGLHQGLGFALSNLTWAAGQAAAASASGVLAQATSDLVPYLLLAFACLGTLVVILRTRDGGLTTPSASAAPDARAPADERS